MDLSRAPGPPGAAPAQPAAVEAALRFLAERYADTPSTPPAWSRWTSRHGVASRGTASADVFTDGDRRLVVVRSWPVDPVARTAAEELASQPLQAGAEVGRIDVDDGVLVVLYR